MRRSIVVIVSYDRGEVRDGQRACLETTLECTFRVADFSYCGVEWF